ncbi:MAG: hypothetical protein HY000_20380, partial [Planctomycetes bacterium]|nr:hypothetical protein [Planctomycetota bacterium]
VEAIEQIVQGDVEETTNIVQRLYKAPIQEKLIAKRVEQIKQAGVPCAVSGMPVSATAARPKDAVALTKASVGQVSAR